MTNAKSKLYEFVKKLGYIESAVQFNTNQNASLERFVSTVTVIFAKDRRVIGVGEGTKKIEAEVDAAENILAQILKNHEDLIVDWEQLKVEAQAGNALNKLCGYLSGSFDTAEQKSLWLQGVESEKHLVAIFCRLWEAEDSSVVILVVSQVNTVG